MGVLWGVGGLARSHGRGDLPLANDCSPSKTGESSSIGGWGGYTENLWSLKNSDDWLIDVMCECSPLSFALVSFVRSCRGSYGGLLQTDSVIRVNQDHSHSVIQWTRQDQRTKQHFCMNYHACTNFCKFLQYTIAHYSHNVLHGCLVMYILYVCNNQKYPWQCVITSW